MSVDGAAVSEARYRAGKRLWSAEDDERMRREFPDMRTADLAVSLGRTSNAVCARATILGLKKSEAYLASPAACRLRREATPASIERRFKLGQTPPNKGLRRPGWHRGRMRETQFKKGQSSRSMPIGSTRLIDGYVYRKVSEVPHVAYTVNWKAENVLVWTAAHGPLPPGYALKFTNGDRTDCRLENLELISRRDLMKRNSVHNLPKALVETIQLLGALNRKIRRRDDGAQQNQ